MELLYEQIQLFLINMKRLKKNLLPLQIYAIIIKNQIIILLLIIIQLIKIIIMRIMKLIYVELIKRI